MDPVGNVTECTKDSELTLKDFENAFYSLEKGFMKKSKDLILVGFGELGAGLYEMNKALKGCDVKEISHKILAIVAELKSSDGLVKFVYDELTNIYKNRVSIVNEFKKAIQMFKAQDYKNAGIQLGEIVGVLLE